MKPYLKYPDENKRWQHQKTHRMIWKFLLAWKYPSPVILEWLSLLVVDSNVDDYRKEAVVFASSK